MISAVLLAQLITWQWVGDPPGTGNSFYRAPRTVTDGAVTCSFVYDDKAYASHVACSSNGHELWRRDAPHVFIGDAALAIDGTTFYAARISNIASGCVLDAYDLRTGRERWSVPLVGLGPISHSKYSNAVELRIVAHDPVVFGWEAAGKYIESRDAATGAMRQHTLVP